MAGVGATSFSFTLGVDEGKLRFFTPAGERVLTSEERAQAIAQQLETEQQRSERLAAKLRELGVDPDQA